MSRLREKLDRKIILIPALCLFWVFCVFFNIPHVLTIFPFLKEHFGEVIAVLSGVILILYLIFKEKRKKDFFLFAAVLLFAEIALVSWARREVSAQLILYNYFAFPLASVLLFSLFFDLDYRRFLIGLFIYYFALSMLNAYSMLKYATTGMSLANGQRDYGICLVGNINLSFTFTMTALAAGIAAAELYCGWIWIGNIVLLGFSFYASYERGCDAATIALAGLAVVMVIVLISKKVPFIRKLTKPFGGWFFFALSVVVGAAVMILYRKGISVFGMDPAFHGRKPIWDFVLKGIAERPLFGRGAIGSLSDPDIPAVHAHNLYLHYLYCGGIIGLLLFVLLIVLTARALEKVSYQPLRFGLSGLFGCFLIAGQLDAFTTVCLFAFLAAFYYITAHAEHLEPAEKRVKETNMIMNWEPQERFLPEKISAAAGKLYRKYQVPFLTGMIVGLIAHAYMLFNKLPSYDDINYFFSKGATYTSGRWALGILEKLLPSLSMPWLLGLFTVFFISVSACFIVAILKIENRVLQGLTAGIAVSFPYFISLFAFMFASFSDALAILISTAAVYFFLRRSRILKAVALGLLTVALGIYQPYLAYAAGLLILVLMRDCLDRNNEEKLSAILLRGVQMLVFMGLAVGLYFIINKVFLVLTHTALSEYGTGKMAEAGVFARIGNAYRDFFGSLKDDRYGFMGSHISEILHRLMEIFDAAALICLLCRKDRIGKKLLFGGLLIIFPLALNALFLLFDGDFHTLMMYSRICLYLFALLLAELLTEENGERKIGAYLRDAGCLVLALLILINTYVANRSYLNLQIVYENAYANAVSVMTRIEMLPERTEGMPIAVIGSQEMNISQIYFSSGGQRVFGVWDAWNHLAYMDDFMLYYLGYLHYAAPAEVKAALSADPRVAAMPVYPLPGSVGILDGVVVVKLSQTAPAEAQ